MEISYKKIKYFGIWFITTIIAALTIGIPTAVIQNPFFRRMAQITVLDYFFLIAISILVGVYVTAYLYKRKESNKSVCSASGGFFIGFLAIACPLCNALLISIFGVAFLLAFIEPLKPVFGTIAVILLLMGIYFMLKETKHKGGKK